jgi:Protein of unknown function (DUF2800)
VTWMDPVRSWTTTAGEIRAWAYQVLYPAMKKAGEMDFKLGSWCQFCKVKLACPKMRELGNDAGLAHFAVMEAGEPRLPNMDDTWLGEWYGRLAPLRMFIKAIGDEVSRRVLHGKPIENAKLVNGLVDREWKPGAPLEATFGDDAWQPQKMRSPAALATALGDTVVKEFIAEWAQSPKPPLVVAPLSDKRKAQKFVTTEEKFKLPVAIPTEAW